MLSKLYRHNLTLLTDLYQLTMDYGYHHAGLADREAVFHLFYRKNPFGGKYAVAAGLELALDYLQNLRFDVHDIQYLGGLTGADGSALFDETFLNYLQRARFRLDVDAVPEGTLVQPHVPLLRIQGPLWQAQLVETALLNLVNFSTLIATKAHRTVRAAGGSGVLEFGLRRAQGIDGGISASRAAYLGGCDATSNVLAGKLCGIPVRGTHAHAWVMCFDSELESFRAYAAAQPNNCVFLVDTYDTVEGVKNAITVGRELRARGHELNGIRLDSGDLAALSKTARELLDASGFGKTKIIASNDLDEFRIAELRATGAEIAVWGVGTRLATAYDQPALGGVYKLAAIRDEEGAWQDRIKLSENPIKVSNPGILNARRFVDPEGVCRDLIYDEKHLPAAWSGTTPDGRDQWAFFGPGAELLVPVMRDGAVVYDSPKLRDIRAFCLDQATTFGEPAVYLEAGLAARRAALMKAAIGE